MFFFLLARIERCLEDRLKPYANKVESQNAFIYHVPPMKDKEEKYFLPYIGQCITIFPADQIGCFCETPTAFTDNTPTTLRYTVNITKAK